MDSSIFMDRVLGSLRRGQLMLVCLRNKHFPKDHCLRFVQLTFTCQGFCEQTFAEKQRNVFRYHHFA